ncbi:MAG: DNRLRE domain-containing protein, partial [bacterium]
MKKLYQLIFIILFLITVSESYGERYYECNVSADTYICEGIPNTNRGDSESLRLGYHTQWKEYRVLAKFDLSSIPKNDRIAYAGIGLWYQGWMGNNNNRWVDVYRIDRNWEEMNATWNNMYYNYAAPSYDNIEVGGQYAKYFYWNATELVKKWYDNSYSNYGVMFISTGYLIDNVHCFTSKEKDITRAPFLYIYCNKLPNKCSNPTPKDKAIKINADVTLTWTCSDPDGDTIKDYCVWFGTESTLTHPMLYGRLGTSTPSFTPSKYGVTLSTGTTYYWKVIGSDGFEWQEQADIWQFLVGIDTGPFKVSGTFMYQDKPYTINGFNFGEYYEPIRYAQISVFEKNEGGEEEIGSGSTGNLGGFDITIKNNIDSAPETPGRDIFVRCYSYSSRTDDYRIHAGRVTGTNTFPYEIKSKIQYNWEGGDLSFGTIKEPVGTVAAAFNILDVITDGYEWAAGPGILFPDKPPEVAVFWPDDSENRSFYRKSDKTIHLTHNAKPEEGVINPAEYDDGVILHEYGHFLMDQYSYSHSPGGAHSWLQQVDSRLAWSEGWAHFVACVTNNNPENYVNNYFDNNSPRAYGFNLETTEDSNGNQPPINYGKENEGLVAGTLWDINDNHIDGKDTLMMGSEEIWDVFDKYITNSMTCDIEDFWKGWFAYNYGYGAQVWDIFMQHGMQLDTTSPSKVTNLQSPSHTPWKTSNNPYVSVRWTHALDAESGIASYSVAWDKSPLTTPDTQADVGAINSLISNRLEDVYLPFGWWFHIRGVDRAGNWGPAEHLGPFLIDTIPPKAELVPESVP